jgi:hypothetical protein
MSSAPTAVKKNDGFHGGEWRIAASSHDNLMTMDPREVVSGIALERLELETPMNRHFLGNSTRRIEWAGKTGSLSLAESKEVFQCLRVEY